MREDGNLKRWRSVPGLRVTMDDLAREASVSIPTIWAAQKGRTSVASLLAIADAMERLRPGQGLTLDELVGRTVWNGGEK